MSSRAQKWEGGLLRRETRERTAIVQGTAFGPIGTRARSWTLFPIRKSFWENSSNPANNGSRSGTSLNGGMVARRKAGIHVSGIRVFRSSKDPLKRGRAGVGGFGERHNLTIDHFDPRDEGT